MSIYLRGENWYIDFVFKGQRVRESIGASRKGAEKVISKKKAEIAENKFLDVRKELEPVKFHDFAKEYVAWAKVNRKPSSHVRRLSLLRQLDKEFGTKTLQEITTWQIEKWKAKRKEKIKPASVNRELAVLKHVYTKAIEWGKVKESPARKVKLFKGEVNRVRYLLPEEIRKLLSNCSDILKPSVTVALHAGARLGEVLGLVWGQVSIEQGFITLLDTKNGDRRDIPMNETVKALLKGMERKEPYVFGGEKNVSPLQVWRPFQEALEKSEITDFRFHDCRHTFASNLIMQEGVELNDVRELLGHKSMSMTMRYAHLSPKHRSRVICLLDRVMSQNPPQEEGQKKVVSIRG